MTTATSRKTKAHKATGDAYLYLRISSDPTGQSVGVDRQERLCRDLAKRRGLTVRAVYRDNDVSAYKGKRRKGFEDLLANLSHGGTVVAYHPDRLYRHPKDLERFVDAVEAAKADVATVAGGDLDLSTASGRMVARMLGAAARGESERIGERVSAAHQASMAQGRYRGRIPFGYAPNGTGSLTPHPVHGPLVQDAVADLLAGASVTSVAKRWTALGLEGKTPTSVRRTLESPALCGRLSSGQTGDWTPLITVAEWESVQALLAANKAKAVTYPDRGGRRPSTLLGGLLVCAEHGCPLFGASHETYRATGVTGCGVSVHRTVADRVVREAVRASFTRHRKAWAKALEPAKPLRAKGSGPDLSARRQAVLDLLAQGLVTPAEASETLRGLSEQIDRETTERRPSVVLPGDPAEWESWDVEHQRAVVSLVLEPVTIAHGGYAEERVGITYRA
jgi:DNA invertase Pin-like site-specific DNA recombinase